MTSGTWLDRNNISGGDISFSGFDLPETSVYLMKINFSSYQYDIEIERQLQVEQKRK